VDHTPLDIMVRDEKSGEPLPRPYLTVVLDRYSRLVVGFCISFHPPSWLTVMLALKMALGDKQKWLAQFNGIDGPWPDTGAPLGFVNDQGKEFGSSSMDTTLVRIGAQILDLPRRRPNLKGKVEAYLDTLQEGTIHNLDGTTFRNIDERGEYLPSKNAIFSVRAIHWIVTKFIVDFYNQRPHAGLMNEIPLERWNASVEKYGRRPTVDDQLLIAFLGESDQSQADRRGIRIDHLFYNSKKLATIRNKCAKLGALTDPDEPVNVMLWRSRDLLNLGAIQVLDPISNRWISVECTWPAYAEGRTHRQHQITVDQLNAKGMRINEENLMAAMNAIHDEIDEIKAGVKRSGQLKDIARFEDTGPTPHDTIEPSQYDSAASAQPISAGLGTRTTRVSRSKATNPSYGPSARRETSSSSATPKTGAPAHSERTTEASPNTSPDRTGADQPPNTIAREARAKAFHKLEDL
jgi:putative transposase